MGERDPLSMSTDNTAQGRPDADTVEGGPISKVAIGDSVVDSTGKELGSVKFAKMGDPNAATTEGQWGDSAGLLSAWGNDYDIAQLPEQAQGEFMRVGFIHIDISLAPDKFAGAGMIDRVADNTVYLNVPEANLI
ncbi:MAG: hypothetical protein H0T18_04210 [Chloroflexia bacterium]|nr:hypothetical protein [Chloroflexia bacterium]